MQRSHQSVCVVFDFVQRKSIFLTRECVPIDSYEDVADEVDEFHLQRDKVLLGDSTRSGKRRGRNEDEESEVEEVYGLGMDEDDDEDDEGDLEEYATTDDEQDEDLQGGRRVAIISDEEDEDEKDEEDGIEGWGTSKSAYYGGNEEAIETEQDALDEEAEARRIQKKQLAAMAAEDFMLDMDDCSSSTPATNTTTATKTTKLITTTETLTTEIPSDLSPEARLSLLKTRNPEFEPLSGEFLELQRIYPVLAAQAETGGEVSQVRYKALAAYLGVLAMYFALLTREEGGSWNGVKEHGVMKGLIRCRQLWERVKGLQEDEERGEEQGDVEMADGVSENDEEEEEEEETAEIEPQLAKQLAKVTITNGARTSTAPRKRAKLDLDSPTTITTTTPTSDSTKKTRPIRTTTDLSDLSNLIPSRNLSATASIKPTKPKTLRPSQNPTASDFSDPTTLSNADRTEKSARRSSLRFHAAQLLSKSAIRASAAKASTGDTDLPRKDRHPTGLVKRQNHPEQDLDNESLSGLEEGPSKDKNEDPDLQHYHALTSTSRKAQRASTAANNEFTSFNPEEQDDNDPSGKRAIGYTIEKNKGLTPHRKKDVRNPRVKKRKAYEKAKKKLRTVKSVYDGKGQGGAYGGEKTGIKKGIVRSRKLK